MRQIRVALHQQRHYAPVADIHQRHILRNSNYPAFIALALLVLPCPAAAAEVPTLNLDPDSANVRIPLDGPFRIEKSALRKQSGNVTIQDQAVRPFVVEMEVRRSVSCETLGKVLDLNPSFAAGILTEERYASGRTSLASFLPYSKPQASERKRRTVNEDVSSLTNELNALAALKPTMSDQKTVEGLPPSFTFYLPEAFIKCLGTSTDCQSPRVTEWLSEQLSSHATTVCTPPGGEQQCAPCTQTGPAKACIEQLKTSSSYNSCFTGEKPQTIQVQVDAGFMAAAKEFKQHLKMNRRIAKRPLRRILPTADSRVLVLPPWKRQSTDEKKWSTVVRDHEFFDPSRQYCFYEVKEVRTIKTERPFDEPIRTLQTALMKCASSETDSRRVSCIGEAYTTLKTSLSTASQDPKAQQALLKALDQKPLNLLFAIADLAASAKLGHGWDTLIEHTSNESMMGPFRVDEDPPGFGNVVMAILRENGFVTKQRLAQEVPARYMWGDDIVTAVRLVAGTHGEPTLGVVHSPATRPGQSQFTIIGPVSDFKVPNTLVSINDLWRLPQGRVRNAEGSYVPISELFHPDGPIYKGISAFTAKWDSPPSINTYITGLVEVGSFIASIAEPKRTLAPTDSRMVIRAWLADGAKLQDSTGSIAHQHLTCQKAHEDLVTSHSKADKVECTTESSPASVWPGNMVVSTKLGGEDRPYPGAPFTLLSDVVRNYEGRMSGWSPAVARAFTVGIETPSFEIQPLGVDPSLTKSPSRIEQWIMPTYGTSFVFDHANDNNFSIMSYGVQIPFAPRVSDRWILTEPTRHRAFGHVGAEVRFRGPRLIADTATAQRFGPAERYQGLNGALSPMTGLWVEALPFVSISAGKGWFRFRASDIDGTGLEHAFPWYLTIAVDIPFLSSLTGRFQKLEVKE